MLVVSLLTVKLIQPGNAVIAVCNPVIIPVRRIPLDRLSLQKT